MNECIESICNQTYKNIEIILIDDGSKDNSGKICDEYASKDERIKVIHKENKGLSSARNKGIDVANGEYISFIDSDDKIANNFIEKLYILCKKNNADIAESDYLKFENEIILNEKEEKIKIYSPIEMQNNLYLSNNIRSTIVCNKLYKKYIYNNLRFPLGKINEDEFCTYKAFDNSLNNIVTTNIPLYYYRYNPTSIMEKKFTLKRYDILDALEEREKYYLGKKYEELYLKTIILHIKTLMWLYTLTKENIEEPDKYLQDLKSKIKEKYKTIKNDKKISYKFKFKIYVFMRFSNFIVKLKQIKILKYIMKKIFMNNE